MTEMGRKLAYVPLMGIAIFALFSPLQGVDVNCQDENIAQTCGEREDKLESCLSGKCFSSLDEFGLEAWLQCARGHGPSLAIAGQDLAEASALDIGEVLGISLQDAQVVHHLVTLGKLCSVPQSRTAEDKQVGSSYGLDTIYRGRETEVPDLPARLANFERVLCGKCKRRGVDCKCGNEDDSPVNLLREYAALYAHWNDFVSEQGRFVLDIKYVVVQVAEHEGVGNQMLKMITGLLFALNMNRALVVQPLTPGARSSLDPVIDFFTEYPLLDSVFSLQLDNPRTLDSFMCDDVESVWGGYDVLILENAMQAPHLFLNNPHFGSTLRKRLLDLPVFFLSHFFWSGALHRSAVVASLPRTMPWDGPTSFEALAGHLDAARARVVGFHVRTGAAQAVRFIQFDHAKALREWNATSANRAGDFCNGHPASMETMFDCFVELLEGLRAQEADATVVVLWAVDQGPITAELQRRIASLDNVCVTQIVHDAEAGHGADDVVRKRDSGLFDLELLSLSESVLGGTGSTFSYLAHARALALPKYSAFLKPGGPKCAAAGGSEAGLITAGNGYTKCTSVGGFDVKCEAEKKPCVGVLIQLWKYEICLQDRAMCWQKDLEWLQPFLVDVEYVRYFQSFLARMRGVFQPPPNSEPMHYPSCYPEPHWR